MRHSGAAPGWPAFAAEKCRMRFQCLRDGRARGTEAGIVAEIRMTEQPQIGHVLQVGSSQTAQLGFTITHVRGQRQTVRAIARRGVSRGSFPDRCKVCAHGGRAFA